MALARRGDNLVGPVTVQVACRDPHTAAVRLLVSKEAVHELAGRGTDDMHEWLRAIAFVGIYDDVSPIVKIGLVAVAWIVLTLRPDNRIQLARGDGDRPCWIVVADEAVWGDSFSNRVSARP